MGKKRITKRKPPRSAIAVHANTKKGGPMKHRLEPKKGAKNDQPEFIGELAYSDDECLCEFHEGQVEVIKIFCPIHRDDDNEEEHEFDL